MHRFAAVFISLQIFIFFAYASQKEQRYTIYASKIKSQGDIVRAQGDIVIYNDESVFSANEAIYNKKSQIITLKGGVTLFFNDKMINKSDYIRFNLKKGTFLASNVFMKEIGSDIWIKSKKVKADKNNYKIKKASLSSCPSKHPDWQVKFSTAHFHKDKEYVSLYNPRFYLGKVPILYLPWVAFPTIDERRSGLLRPLIGFENSENLLFMQPIFYAPSLSWDIQFNPQIRLDRGVGLYTTFRFADSPYSKGHIRVGFFNEKSAYVKKHNLENSVHKGISFYYKNEAVFTKYIKENPYDYKDGLLADITLLNDIDYINLKDDRKYAVNKLVTSRLNYYMSGYQDYFGAYARYFIDTQKLSNADTMQTLPSLQYHQFSQILGSNNFLYSIDYKFKNSYRREGLGARQHEFSLPFVFTMPLFENLLNFSISENLYYSQVNYTDKNASVENARYFSNYHSLVLDTDLMKKYSLFSHNLQASVSFTIPSINKKKGYFADFIPFNLEKKSINFKLNNYFYDNNGYGFLIDRFTQKYYYKKEDKLYNEAENEIIYLYSKNLTLRNTLIYSYEYKKLKKIQSGIRYHDDYNNLRIDHTYKNAPNETKINFISGDYERVVDKYYSLLGGLDYDFDNSFTKEWRLGVNMKKKCWSYEIKYKESITPSLTSAGAESIRKRGIYLIVKFAHIGGIKYKYIKDIENAQKQNGDILQNLPIPIDDENDQNHDLNNTSI